MPFFKLPTTTERNRVISNETKIPNADLKIKSWNGFTKYDFRIGDNHIKVCNKGQVKYKQT